MNAPNYLKPWLAGWSWGVRISLFLILLSAIMQFATFALSQNYVISYLGAQPEDISFSIQICYAGILTMLPVQVRFLRYFEMKYYLLFIIFCGIVLSLACMVTTNIILFFIIRFLQGMVVCCVAASMLTLISGFLKPDGRVVIASYIFYGTVLSSGVLIGIVASQVSLNSDFTNIYYYLVLFQVFTLCVILLGFSAKSGVRPYPLYQVDWPGAIFFITAAGGLAYTMIYGSKYYWFTDKRIVLSAIITIAGILLYLCRELTVKRPLINLSVFKYRKFWIGLILLALYYGMKESINLVFGYTAAVLQWSTMQLMVLALCNIAGLIFFMIISERVIVKNKQSIPVFLAAGFLMLLLYHVWMYFIFTPDLAFNDLVLPLFFQGAASGVLFAPIVIFILTSVPQTTGITGLVVAAYARFTALLNAGAGFYNLQLYYNQLYKESFLAHLTGTDEQTNEWLDNFKQLFQSKGYPTDQVSALANASLAKALGLQGQLLANKATFLFIAVILVIVLLLMLLTFIYNAWRKSRQAITGELVKIGA